MKVAILYERLFDADGREQLVGGVETYLLNLGRLCVEMGWETTIFQFANRSFERNIDGLKAAGVSMKGVKHGKRRFALFEAVEREIDLSRDILIFGADHVSVPTDNRRCIAIQHGVSWDLPTKYFTKKKWCESGFGAKLKKYVSIRESIRFFKNCPNVVCVDYNFWNWLRTHLSEEPDKRIWIIPNFTSKLAEPAQIEARANRNGAVRVLFARRFTHYRGARIFAEAAREILRTCPDTEVTFAGEGPEKEWLQHQFDGERRVSFTKYLPDEMLQVHLKHDIAAVPSIASEGTSFSVAEAMGAGCAVVATAVGGITNMIIDGYNGLLVMPDAKSLLAGLESVVRDGELRLRIGRNAYETARSAFSLELWKTRWKSVLQEVEDG